MNLNYNACKIKFSSSSLTSLLCFCCLFAFQYILNRHLIMHVWGCLFSFLIPLIWYGYTRDKSISDYTSSCIPSSSLYSGFLLLSRSLSERELDISMAIHNCIKFSLFHPYNEKQTSCLHLFSMRFVFLNCDCDLHL